MKILAYNSSARGAGQFIRSLKVAKIITDEFISSTFLIIAGNSYVDKVLPSRTDVLRLPEISKDFEGVHVSRLNDLKETFLIRQEIINSTFKSFNPDVLLVDSRPVGLNGELLSVLKNLKSRKHCKAVLLLRDIVDAPEIVKVKWSKEKIYKIIDEYYDKIVVLGDKNLYDMTKEYDLTLFDEKIFHLGYLRAEAKLGSLRYQTKVKEGANNILVTVGGGHDGASLIHSVCELIDSPSAPTFPKMYYIVLGANSPLNIDDLFDHYRNLRGRAKIFSHLKDLGRLMSEAEIVISMCGYNSITELIEKRKKIIAIPRVVSGREQLIRCKILSNAYDGIWVLPKDKATPERLSWCIEQAFFSPPPRREIKMDGHENLINFFKKRLGFEK